MSLADLLEKAKAATPGPYRQGWISGQGHRHCDCSRKGPLIAILQSEKYPEWGDIHYHESDWHDDDHEIVTAAPPFTKVAGNFDYEDGGIVRPEDTAFFAACSPERIVALVESHERLRKALAAAYASDWAACDKCDEVVGHDEDGGPIVHGICARHNLGAHDEVGRLIEAAFREAPE